MSQIGKLSKVSLQVEERVQVRTLVSGGGNSHTSACLSVTHTEETSWQSLAEQGRPLPLPAHAECL